MGDLFLSVDAGGTAVKAAAFDLSGRLVALRAIDVATRHGENGWVERAPEELWRLTAAAIRDLTSTEIDPARVAAVACTGFGNGVFLVDAEGRGVRHGIVSVDHRAQPIVDELVRSGQDRAIEAVTGQRIWGGQTLMQLVWLARHEPDAIRRARWALCCKDYVRMRLTGEAATDPTDASGGGLLALAGDVYDPALFEMLGIPEVFDRLPPVFDNSSIAGTISREAAGETGLREGTPVAAAMMDVGACVVGSGVVSGEALTMIAGTWSINAVETTGPIEGRPPILNMLHRDRHCRLLADGSPTSASNLSWYLAAVAGETIDPQRANALVAASPVKVRRCHFMPFVNGPAPRRGAFVGLVNADDQGSMLRAIYEGVAFQHRRHGEAVVSHVATGRPSVISLAGGASRSPVWSQIFADVTGLPVAVADGEEFGALGAAVCAAVAMGIHPSIEAAALAMCRTARIVRPDPDVRDFYEARYRAFLRLDQQLAGLFEETDQPDA
jgi:L-xylulokinase